MTRTLRRLVVVILVALALFGLFASAAFASLEDTPTPTLGTSSSNPGWGADYWWRGDWGNTLYPDFELNPPAPWDESTDGYLVGSIYTIDRTLAPLRSTYIDTTTPEAYYRDNFPTAIAPIGGTLTARTLDMLGIYMNPPSGSWPATETGAHSPLEGHWYYHYSFYSNFRYQNDSYTIPFGIDLTPPRAVTGLRVGTGLTHSSVTTWTPATRAYISWDASQTDDLSGDGYFQVLLDDKPYVPEASATPTLGRAYQIPGLPTPSAITIENVPPGKHKVSIQPVDRATNVGPATGTYFYSDPDTPTIAFTSPLSSVLSNKTLFSVNASDLAGDPTVEFFMDGTSTRTISVPPYAYKPDLSGLSSGTHTLSATVTDHLGRHVTISKTVSFSNTVTSDGFMIPGVADFAPRVPVSLSNPLGDKWRVDKLRTDVAWGNSLHPDFSLPAGSEVASFPADGEGDVVGMLYDVRRSPELIDQTVPKNYFRSVRPMVNIFATHLDTTIDMASVMAYPPLGGWPAPDPGTEQPVEGIWYLQYKAFTDLGWAESPTNYVRFGIDLTSPTAPTGLVASPTTGTPLPGNVTAGTRMHFTWLSGDYDELSGVSYYQVLLDGVKVIPDGANDQGRVVDIPGRAEPAVTIENLTAGKHTFEVEAVDRAGNVGAATSTAVYSDPDTPTISITSPSGSLIGVKPTVSATAADQGGVVSVVFRLDGTLISTMNSAPYSSRVDLSAFSDGPHTLTATVTDRFGRTATASKSVTLDKTALSISSVKATGSGRKVSIAFNVSRAATVKLSLKIAGMSKTVTFAGPARYTFTYTYPKRSSRYPSPLSFNDTFAISASDSLGNTASASGKVKVNIARIVRVSGSKVKIIYY